eukprot:2858788-Rhodomonas_salina.2
MPLELTASDRQAATFLGGSGQAWHRERGSEGMWSVELWRLHLDERQPNFELSQGNGWIS